MIESIPHRAGACLLAALAPLSTALADPAAVQPPVITITADRVEEPVSQTASSITIVPASTIEKFGVKGVADVLEAKAGTGEHGFYDHDGSAVPW